jgi:DNA modification methylase
MNPPQAAFIFKLRHNIALEGDLALALMEIEAFLPAVQYVQSYEDILAGFPVLGKIEGLGAVAAFVRPSGKQFFIAGGRVDYLVDHLSIFIRRLSFVQDIYCIVPNAAASALNDLENEVGPVIEVKANGDHLIVHAVPHYALIELSETVAKRAKDPAETKRNLQLVLDTLLDRTQDAHARSLADVALQTKITTAHLSHDIHYYKAKFFPRMVRAMINRCVAQLGGGEHRIIDNFVGSGTTLLEAAILGIPSVGLDIDPLSCLIAQMKLKVATYDSSEIAAEAARVRQFFGKQSAANPNQLALFPESAPDVETLPVTFPSWLLKNRKMTPEIADQLSREIRKVQAAIASSPLPLHAFLQVLLSDAISRRVRMRLLGTGVGRFALTFSKATLPQMFVRSLEKYARVVAVYEWLREVIHLPFAPAEVINADTRCIPPELGQFDILVTSPPYLPASSGRESYAKARALSLIALDLADGKQVDSLVDQSVGSMDDAGVELNALTPQERATVDWLANDDLRAIKAIPTARYFLDMRETFRQMFNLLRPGGLAVVVSGTASTFYEFSTRQIVHTVKSAELLAEEARVAGFEVEALHHLQLQKSNANARPRSLDDYYETLIMLRKAD